MASSKTEICNLALGWLGGKRLTDVESDPSLDARLCNANYDLSRTAVLEEREWSFATKRVALTPLSTPPKFGYDYQFLLPSDLLMVLSAHNPLHTDIPRPPGISYIREENNLLADLQVVHIRYIVNLTNTTRFSGLFTQCLAAHIAANIAVGLTENATQQERMFAIYDDKLGKAISSDSMQGSNDRIETSQLEKSRRMVSRPM